MMFNKLGSFILLLCIGGYIIVKYRGRTGAIGIEKKLAILDPLEKKEKFDSLKKNVDNNINNHEKTADDLEKKVGNNDDIEKTADNPDHTVKVIKNPDPMQKTLERIKMIKKDCGDLCDTTKKIEPGEFIGSVTAKVDCPGLFESPHIQHGGDLPPQSWQQLPEQLRDLYKYGGRVKITPTFYNTVSEGIGRTKATVFSKEHVETLIKAFNDGKPQDTYTNGSNLVAAAADHINVTGKTVLVIGTQNPWLEAVLLSKQPKKVVSLEYGFFISEYPGHEFLQMPVFREKFLNGSLDRFDVVFSYSSLEHSGLGRYGDPLNPWADIIAVAQAWCASAEDAKLAIGVPTMVSRGADINAFNAHRIYGPVMYPFLTTNWRFEWPTRDIDRVDQHPQQEPVLYHPVFVFNKVSS